MATSASTAVDPYLQDYYALQTQNVTDNYGIQKDQNTQAKGLSDLSYQQKMQALQNKLDTEQDTMSDPYANRGLLHSGIYNWNQGNYGNWGAKQQFAYNSATAQGNLSAQLLNSDAAFNQKGADLQHAETDQLQGIQKLPAADVARSAIGNAIAGG